MYQTHRRWWNIADASRLLRVSKDALYDACRDGFPHTRLYDGGPILIDCETLRMEWVPDEATKTVLRRSKASVELDPALDPLQLALPLEGLKKVRVWRNTGRPVGVHSYERELWGHNQR